MTEEEMFKEAEQEFDRIVEEIYKDSPQQRIVNPEDELQRAIRSPEVEIRVAYR